MGGKSRWFWATMSNKKCLRVEKFQIMKNSVIILWLEGENPARLSEVPVMGELARDGVGIQLTPLPLFEKGCSYWQTLTGMRAGKIGRFDPVRPGKYDVLEDSMLPDG